MQFLKFPKKRQFWAKNSIFTHKVKYIVMFSIIKVRVEIGANDEVYHCHVFDFLDKESLNMSLRSITTRSTCLLFASVNKNIIFFFTENGTNFGHHCDNLTKFWLSQQVSFNARYCNNYYFLFFYHKMNKFVNDLIN